MGQPGRRANREDVCAYKVGLVPVGWRRCRRWQFRKAKAEQCMSKLDAIIEKFQDLDGRDRLELLVDFADKLADLPESYQAERDAGLHRVPECMTPTFLWVQCISSRVSIHAYVAREAPTVKGFISILVQAFNGTMPDEVAAAPPDLLHRLGLAELLGMNRLLGLNAVQQRLKNEIRKAAVLAV